MQVFPNVPVRRRCALVDGEFVKMPGARIISRAEDGSFHDENDASSATGILLDHSVEIGLHFASPRPTPPPSRGAPFAPAPSSFPRGPNAPKPTSLGEACASGDLQKEAGRELEKEVGRAGCGIMLES